MEPKVSQACQTTGPSGGRYARRVGGYAGNLIFHQQSINLEIEPATVAWLPYNVPRKTPTNQCEELPCAGIVEFQTRRQLYEDRTKLFVQAVDLFKKRREDLRTTIQPRLMRDCLGGFD